jgi:hypothetical protein
MSVRDTRSATVGGLQTLDLLAALAQLGLDRQALDRPDSRIPTEQFVAILPEAERRRQDPFIGMHAGERCDSRDRPWDPAPNAFSSSGASEASRLAIPPNPNTDTGGRQSKLPRQLAATSLDRPRPEYEKITERNGEEGRVIRGEFEPPDLWSAMSRSMCEGQRKQPKRAETPGHLALLSRRVSVVLRLMFTDRTPAVVLLAPGSRVHLSRARASPPDTNMRRATWTARGAREPYEQMQPGQFGALAHSNTRCDDTH